MRDTYDDESSMVRSKSAGGPGVEQGSNGDLGKTGYTCEGRFPLTGPFWTRPSKGGEA